MIQRYLGNKNSLANHILREVERFCAPGDRVCDIFSGTISMSMAFKKNGYAVISNDINLFSYHFAKAFLENNTIPSIDLDNLGINASSLRKRVEKRIEDKIGHDGFRFLDNPEFNNTYRKLVAVLEYLDSITESDIRPQFRAHHFYDTYTLEGNNSYFRSLRGTEGHRRFFTPNNGRRLDLILNKVREWYQAEKLSPVLYSLLISIICESVEKISNTQGTFHDFQREEYDERALNPLELRLPEFDDVLGTNNHHIIGHAEDSLVFIKTAPEHKLLYIDPPYNFRQYTSYYFMLNLISEYCTIPNTNEYFSNISFVRGQNMSNDFDSTFCKANLFIPSLRQLIEDANTEYVILSYYDGRNHSNKGEKRDDSGISDIIALFKSCLFVDDSLEIKSFERTNYQSFKEHTADKCKELLFIGKKRC